MAVCSAGMAGGGASFAASRSARSASRCVLRSWRKLNAPRAASPLVSKSGWPPGARPVKLGKERAARIGRDRRDRARPRAESEPMQRQCSFGLRIARHRVRPPICNSGRPVGHPGLLNCNTPGNGTRRKAHRCAWRHYGAAVPIHGREMRNRRRFARPTRRPRQKWPRRSGAKSWEEDTHLRAV